MFAVMYYSAGFLIVCNCGVHSLGWVQVYILVMLPLNNDSFLLCDVSV
jgi:hypothetical protein